MCSDILEPQDWGFPVPIAYGPGRLDEIAAQCRRLGIGRPLVVTDRGSRELPFVGRLSALLGHASVYSDISPNPRDDEIAAGRAVMRTGNHDAVIAIGGGSAMDGGKAICLTARNEVDLWAFNFDLPKAPQISAPFPHLICIPTTAGTGAETESTAMVTDTAKGMKFCLWHEALKPSLALLDPELTLGVPPHLTAWTGADALTHAIEAFCVPGLNPLCDGLALEALTLISTHLAKAVEEPDNLTARGGMLVGSCLAGIAFLKGLGFVHAISHMIGAEFDTQHGLTNAIVLPVVLRHNLPHLPEKTARMGQAMGMGPLTPAEFTARIEAMFDRLHIPRRLSQIGVPADCIDRIAAKAAQDAAAATNPVPANHDQMCKMIARAISAAR